MDCIFGWIILIWSCYLNLRQCYNFTAKDSILYLPNYIICEQKQYTKLYNLVF